MHFNHRWKWKKKLTGILICREREKERDYEREKEERREKPTQEKRGLISRRESLYGTKED